MAHSATSCAKTTWKGRPAVRLANGAIELTALIGGGPIADLRLSTGSPAQRQNVLWEAPWRSLDPSGYRPRVHNRAYGPESVGRFLAGFTGHTLCLDYFGAPSEEEAKQRLCLHGEASVSNWKVVRHSHSKNAASVVMQVNLPNAGLKFERELRVARGETVVYVSETVSNLRKADHFFHWTEHVTLGPPFLREEESLVYVPARQAMTWPHGYDGKSLLIDSQEFIWPDAPAEHGGTVDISRPFVRRGAGFVAAALLKCELACIAALNFRHGLLLGYCFARAVFPWVTMWEENCARQEPPWEGRTQARGLEFGTTPIPVGKYQTFARGPLFGTPTFRRVPAKGRLQVRYAMFVAPVSATVREISDIQLDQQAITVRGAGSALLRVPARDLKIIRAS